MAQSYHPAMDRGAVEVAIWTIAYPKFWIGFFILIQVESPVYFKSVGGIMSEQASVEKFEKNVLFGIVRWFSLGMGALGLVVLIFGGLMLVKSWTTMKGEKEVKISQKEVQESVAKKERIEQGGVGNTQEPASKSSAEESISPEVKKALKLIDEIVVLLVKDNPNLNGEKLKEFLVNKADTFKESEVVSYLIKMKDVVEKAPAGKKTAFIDSFMELYADKLQKERLKAEEKKFEAVKNVGTYAYLTITGLLTVVSFGIILILAAIERNTRKSAI